MKRLLTAAVLIPVALAGVFVMPDRWFFWAVGGITLLAGAELAKIARHWAPSLNRATLLVGITLVALALAPSAPVLGAAELRLAVVVAMLAVAGLTLLPGVRTVDALAHAGVLGFGWLYLGIAWAAIASLKVVGAPWIFLLLVVVWLSDSGAYYAGRALGRRKLAPVISPNKTWEGAIGGVLAALAGGVGWSLWQVGTVEPVLLAWVLLVAVAGQLGDLFESKLKRGAGVKDSGTLLPGHGGILDRIDALLFAAPVLACGVEYFGLGRLGS